MEQLDAYCSWCNQKSSHLLRTPNKLTRDEYKCENCKNITLKCRIPGCNNMTKGRMCYVPGNTKGVTSFFKTHWDNELCSEHDGTVASFDTLTIQLEDLADYKSMFERDKRNFQRDLAIAGGVVAGTVIIGLSFGSGAPAVASALGSTGLLGSASTGIAISSLSGAALESASLAAIGGGSIAAGGFGVAGGTLFLTAAGAALGGWQGGALSNTYFGDIKDFSIQKVREGTGTPIILINGFLSQKNQNCSDWLTGIRNRYPDNPCYYVTWESKCNYELGTLASKGYGKLAFKKFVNRLAKKASRKAASKANPSFWISSVTDLVSNPYHVATFKASETGLLLADLISRVKNDEGYVLMGHSLGCRVIYYLLSALSTTNRQLVKEVHLFGGAMASAPLMDWQRATRCVSGNLYNYYSSNDLILKYLYRIANLWTHNPIGLTAIDCPGKIKDIDVTQTVNGHMDYKNKLQLLLQ